MLVSGEHVGRYLVLDLLGEGAMGEVYRAWDTALDRVVALKTLAPGRATVETSRERFAREARLAARINHPAVAHIYDVGLLPNEAFIAMEFVAGRQLRAEMQGPIAVGRVVFLARQILEGVAEAHRSGVVHRDLKPENIMLSGRDQIKILDFGLAKPIDDEASKGIDVSGTGLTGTPRYMSPEQVQGHAVGRYTDVYALGTVFYEMLTGHPIHGGDSLVDILMDIVHRPAPALPASLCAPALSAVIARAVEKHPQDRFADADAMLAALETVDVPREPRPPLLRASGVPAHIPHPRAQVYTQRAREALSGTQSSSSMAIELLEQAIELDPQYAAAHALYAEACAALFNVTASPKWFDRAEASLLRAESLDPGLPDFRIARARMLWTRTFNFPAETALRELRWALLAEPTHVGGRRLYTTITAHVGLFEQATAMIERHGLGWERDETNRGVSATIALARGRPDRAIELVEPELKLDPDREEVIHWWLYAQALIDLGCAEDAVDVLTRSLFRRPKDALLLSLMSVAHATHQDPDASREASQKAQEFFLADLHPHHAYHQIARAESVLGDYDRALMWLRRTVDEGMPCYPWFVSDPLLEGLRESPQGQEIFARLERLFAYFQREFPLDEDLGSQIDTIHDGP